MLDDIRHQLQTAEKIQRRLRKPAPQLLMQKVINLSERPASPMPTTFPADSVGLVSAQVAEFSVPPRAGMRKEPAQLSAGLAKPTAR